MIASRIGLALVVAALFTGCVHLQPEADTRRHVTTLASDAYAGRATGSSGEKQAADYIVAQLRRIGASPLPGKSDYRLPFEYAAGARDGGSSITIAPSGRAARSQTFSTRSDVQALSFSESSTTSGALVFAGYGIVVPPNQDIAYDSYASLDVKDKIVIVLRYFPENAESKAKTVLARYSDLRYKATVARQRGAKALLVVTGPRSPNAGEVVPMAFDSAIAGSGIVAASVSANVAQTIFSGAPRSLEEAQRALDPGDANVHGFELPMTASVVASVLREKRIANNIVAYLPASTATPGTDKPWIAVGAHYDHLGHGEIGNSLAGKGEAGRIHYGADDNASGTAAVLAVAATLARTPRARNILIGFWSGEEIGLLGSTAFIRMPPIPVDQISAYLNFDMVGRMQDNRLIVQAMATSPVWPRILEQTNVAAQFDIALQPDPYQPSDIASFNEAHVPTLGFFTGAHTDYHRPTDTAAKINYADLDRIAAFASAIIESLERLERAPAFVKVEQPMGRGPSRAGVRVFTGTIPDYAADTKGLLVGGVVGGGPADRAGLQKGDTIVEIAGQTIANIYDYTYALEALKAGEPTQVVYVRDGQRKGTQLIPEARK